MFDLDEIESATMELFHKDGRKSTLRTSVETAKNIYVVVNGTPSVQTQFTLVVEMNRPQASDAWTIEQRPAPEKRPYTRLTFRRSIALNVLDQLETPAVQHVVEVPRHRAEEAIRQGVAQGWTLGELVRFDKRDY